MHISDFDELDQRFLRECAGTVSHILYCTITSGENKGRVLVMGAGFPDHFSERATAARGMEVVKLWDIQGLKEALPQERVILLREYANDWKGSL